jgi:hypothetical protein
LDSKRVLQQPDLRLEAGSQAVARSGEQGSVNVALALELYLGHKPTSNRLGRPLPFHRGRDYAFPKALFLTLIHLTSPVMLASELERRLRASGSSVKSVSCHPGFAGTSLFKNGIYPPLERLVRGPGSSPLVALAATELRRSAPPSIAEAGVEA